MLTWIQAEDAVEEGASALEKELAEVKDQEEQERYKLRYERFLFGQGGDSIENANLLRWEKIDTR
jgi:hypothetical protein